MEQYVLIYVGKEKYGIKISDINEIIKFITIIEIPNVSPFIEGVINLRGKIVPVINLSKRFDMEPTRSTKKTRIVVVQFQKEMIGIIVDEVSKVTLLENIEETPDILSSETKKYFSGVANFDEQVIPILDIEEILRTGGE